MAEEAVSTKNKDKHLEDIIGVGPETVIKLVKAGFQTLETLVMATPQELNALGINEKIAEEIIQCARSSTAISFIRGDELFKMHQNILSLTTGSRALDDLLGGGLDTQTITEIYGEYGSGKSQICHQLCVNVQLPIENGGLSGGALYIDSENTFRNERIVQMAKYLNLDPDLVARNIFFTKAYTSDHQIVLLENADKIIKENNIRLIIVDSLTSHFRSEYPGREMLAERQQKLNKYLHKLIRLSRVLNVATVVTNQVMANPDALFGEGLKPVGGHILAHASHTRIFLRKHKQGIRIARLISSPYLPKGEQAFKITINGVEDLAEKKMQRN